MEYLTNFKKFFKKKEQYYLDLQIEDLKCDPIFNKMSLLDRKHIHLEREIEEYLKKLFKFNFLNISIFANCEKLDITIGGSMEEMKRITLHYGIDDNKIRKASSTHSNWTGPK